MKTYSEYIRHFDTNRRFLPTATASKIKREAMDRVIDRWRTGRADGPLDFADLVESIENAISPKPASIGLTYGQTGGES